MIENALRGVRSIFFSDYKEELKKVTRDYATLLDVGCGKGSPVQYLHEGLYSVGVDIFEPALEMSKQHGIHNEYKKMNVLDIDQAFEKDSFECVLASDLIEHLTKEEGLTLIDKMETIAQKRIIIFTPRGFVHQDEYEDNPWQEHKSGWEVAEMREKGYDIIGIHGWKAIWDIDWLWKNGPRAHFLIRILRKFLVDVTQLVTRNRPEHAFQIMCVKTKKHV